MRLYEMMELPDAEEYMNDHWKPIVPTKGPSLPSLLKVSESSKKEHSVQRPEPNRRLVDSVSLILRQQIHQLQ